jgi:hypothetical protein
MNDSTPTFQIKDRPARSVSIGRDPKTGHGLQKQPGWWTLVERER